MTKSKRTSSNQATSIGNAAAAGQMNDSSSSSASTNFDSNEPNAPLEAASCNQVPNSTAKGSGKLGNKNALCHGVFSNEVVLPWESPVEFESLHAAFKDEWQPNGCSEETAVLDLTTATWIKWRAMRMMQFRFYQDPLAVDILKSGKRSMQDILTHQMGVPERTQATLDNLGDVMSALHDTLTMVRNRPYWTTTDDGKNIQSQLSQLTHEISTLIGDVKKEIVPTIHSIAKHTERDLNMFAYAYDSDVIEKQVRVMGAIDARIEKTLHRLTSLKEYKRMSASLARPSHSLEPPSDASK